MAFLSIWDGLWQSLYLDIYNDSFFVPDYRIPYKSLCQFLISVEKIK